MPKPPNEATAPSATDPEDDREVFAGDDKGPRSTRDFSEAEKEEVKNETEDLRQWIKGLSGDDLKTGNWFEKLLAHALTTYAKTATWEWFQDKYPGVPADVIVDQRIKMATRYSALEGGLSASAYSAAIVATLGTAGGASPIALPAAGVTVVVDLAYTSQLQVRLAYDIAVLYRVPVDIDDPEDLWNLVRVAFAIKGGELLSEGAMKAAPVIVRPVLRKIFSGSLLATARSIPFVGKYLLQKTIIKVGIPLVGVPLAIGLNFWTARIAGRYARSVYRNIARVMELANRLSDWSEHPQLLLWVAWLVIQADGKIGDDEALLIRHLIQNVKVHHQVEDDELARVINIEPADVWRRLEAETGDLSDILHAAELIADVDGVVSPEELAILERLRQRVQRQ